MLVGLILNLKIQPTSIYNGASWLNPGFDRRISHILAQSLQDITPHQRLCLICNRSFDFACNYSLLWATITHLFTSQIIIVSLNNFGEICDGYRRIAQTDLNRYIIIEAAQDRKTIAEQVCTYIQQRLL